MIALYFIQTKQWLQGLVKHQVLVGNTLGSDIKKHLSVRESTRLFCLWCALSRKRRECECIKLRVLASLSKANKQLDKSSRVVGWSWYRFIKAPSVMRDRQYDNLMSFFG